MRDMHLGLYFGIIIAAEIIALTGRMSFTAFSLIVLACIVAMVTRARMEGIP